MDMDFAVSCPLVRRWRLISGFCPSTRTFDPCFFQTPPRGGSPCIITRPSPPSGWPEDLHLQAAEHAQHTTKPSDRPPRPSEPIIASRTAAMLIKYQRPHSALRLIGAMRKRTPTSQANPLMRLMIKCILVCHDVITGTPFAIRAGNSPWPATPRPNRGSSQAATRPDRPGFLSVVSAMALPTTAKQSPGTMNPTTFHRAAFGVPIAPNSLMSLVA